MSATHILLTSHPFTDTYTMSKRYIFVSYASPDVGEVLPIVEAVEGQYRQRGLDLNVWVDRKDLLPGQRWDAEITRVLSESIGMLVFISPAAMESPWVSREIVAAAEHWDRLIIPIILSPTPKLPPAIAERQWLDLSGRRTKSDVESAARLIADVTEAHLRGGGSGASMPPIAAAQAPALAATIAQEVRGAQRAVAETSKPPDSVFVVHGHDEEALADTEKYLTGLGVKPVILTRLGGSAQSLLQKFFKSASDARFAIVILSADDLGASRIQYEAKDVGERALQFRARQNVILELGFFYGLLGWENVFVLQKRPEKVFPNFERPSDIEGAVFDPMDSTGAWRETLARKLTEAGFSLKSKGTDKGAKAAARTGRNSKKGADAAAKNQLRLLLADPKYTAGRYLTTLLRNTNLPADKCRQLLREIGAREVVLVNGEGWTLRPPR